jgi:hypothetical protein
MNAFQFLVLGLLALLLRFTVVGVISVQMRKRIGVFWTVVWGGSAGVVVWPVSTVRVARLLGIGRGADLLLYCSVLAMLVGFFYVYIRFRRMDRQLTLLVRELAIRNPGLPPPSGAER